MPQVSHNGAILYYEKIGQGCQSLLLFHGFGQQHHIFSAYAEALTIHYTLYTFDLFFHGNSKWNHGEQPLEKEIWKEFMLRFLSEHKIEKFSVLGFSLGAKFALSTVALFPSQVERLFLLAPDGIRTSFWYSLATYPFLLRKFFKSMIDQPERLHAIASILHFLHLVDRRLLRFAESQMDTQEKRERVYYAWVVFRHLSVDVQKIAGLIQLHSIKLTMIVGKRDMIITAQNMQQLLHHLDDYQLEILDTGHYGIIAGSIPTLVKAVSQ